MILLAVDTSGLAGSLALAKIQGTQLVEIHETAWTKKAMHSEIITLQLQTLLAQAAVELDQITHLAVNCGPGSFTGLRVGLSLVKTLGFARNLPVAAVNTLELLSYLQHSKPDQSLGTGPDEETIFVATKAVQNFYYCARYSFNNSSLDCLLPPQSAAEPELQALSVGSTKVLIEGVSAGVQVQTTAKVVVELLMHLHPPRQYLTWKEIEPLYIRGSEAEEKLKKKGLLL